MQRLLMMVKMIAPQNTKAAKKAKSACAADKK
jgi:hypothetical protein